MAGERTKMAAGARRHLLTVAMSPGPQADGMADGIAVMDSQNVESLPDGSGVCNRRGSRFYSTSALAGRAGVLRLLLNGKVPRTGAPLFAVVAEDGSASAVAKWPYANSGDWQGGESFIEPTCNVVYTSPGVGYWITVPPPSGGGSLVYTIPLRRDGDLSFACTVRYELVPNPAYNPDDPMFLVAGTDYDASTATGTVTFAVGESEKVISVTFYEAAWASTVLRQITVKLTGQDFCVTPSEYGGDNCAYFDLSFMPALVLTRMAVGLTAIPSGADDNGLARAMVWNGDGVVGVYLRATKPGQVVE